MHIDLKSGGILVATVLIGLFASGREWAAEHPNTSYSYALITEPDQGVTSIYVLITSAQHTIDMTMYELNDTTAEQDLAAARGVTVRVILDQNLEKSNNQAAYTYLSDNGVAVHWANPTYQATHQKTITIDGSYSAARRRS